MNHAPTHARQFRRLHLTFTIATLAALLGGCGPGGPIRVRLQPEVERPARGAVILLCDGLDPDLVRRGCEEGWLPNIKQRFADGGTEVRNAITCVPSITYAAITTMLTGTTPAQHGITGIYWFDRRQRRFRRYDTARTYRYNNRDLPSDIHTFGEHLRPEASASVQNALTRGVTANFANWAPSGVRWLFHNYTSVDKMTASTLGDIARWANWHDRWPAGVTLYFPAVDAVGHQHGVSSPEYSAAVAHLDYQLGRVCDWLEREGLLGTTVMALVSDHGMVDIRPDGYIDLVALVRDAWGRHVTDQCFQDGPRDWRARHYDRFDTVVLHHTGRRGAVYFAGPNGWDDDPSPEAIAEILTAPPAQQRIWNVPGIQLVAYRTSDTRVVLRSSRGAARIEESTGPSGSLFRYVPEPDDVLGYMADADVAAFVSAGPHDDRAWLAATADQQIPDVVPQLGPLLNTSRVGDVLIFPEPGYSFSRQAGGHGGVDRGEMRATLYFAGPGIERGGIIEHGRLLDLTPTLLAWLGVDADQQPVMVAGVPLLEQDTQSVFGR